MNASPESPARPLLPPWVGVWLAVSFILGGLGSFIEWGKPSGFHGTGFPVPIVLWDQPPGSDRLLDYPNPFGYLENPVLIFLTGILAWLLVRIFVFTCRSLMRKAPRA